MEKQQTAVEWLHEKFAKATKTELKDNVNLFFKQAKEMEKQQIRFAYMQGQDAILEKFNLTINRRVNSLDYYNTTFKNNNHANS